MAKIFFTRRLERLYAGVAARRRLYAGLGLLLLAVGWLFFWRLPLSTDAAALLPDRGGRAALDFKLLSQAPLARRIVLRLRSRTAIEPAELLQAADALAARLRPPLFTRVLGGPGEGRESALLAFAGSQWANLFNAADYAEIEARLSGPALSEALGRARWELLQPTGFLQKEMILSDPLALRELLFRRLSGLNPVARGRLLQGRFLSADGRETLLFLETPVPLTDYAGSLRLYRELERQSAALPEGLTATAGIGHRYTIANAGAIQRDMVVVLGASLAALSLIFLVFLRSCRALLVFFAAACGHGSGPGSDRLGRRVAFRDHRGFRRGAAWGRRGLRPASLFCPAGGGPVRRKNRGPAGRSLARSRVDHGRRFRGPAFFQPAGAAAAGAVRRSRSIAGPVAGLVGAAAFSGVRVANAGAAGRGPGRVGAGPRPAAAFCLGSRPGFAGRTGGPD